MTDRSNQHGGNGGGGEGNDGSEGASGGDRGRRYPVNLSGALQFAVENTDQSSGSSHQHQPLSEQDRQFLMGALDAVVTDPLQHVKERLSDLREIFHKQDNREPFDLEQLLEILEDLKEWCENMDLANDFHKLGGFEHLPRLLTTADAAVQWRTADLIAALAQNNVYSQQHLLQLGILPQLLQLLDCSDSEEVQVKALYGLSCLVRSMPAAQDKFVELDGFSYLVRAMQTDMPRLKVKAAFLISAICSSDHKVTNTLLDMGMVEQIIGLLHDQHDATHEHIASALLSLISDSERGQRLCCSPELGLRSLLNKRLVDLAQKEEYLEEREYYTRIREMCFGIEPVSSSQALDR